MVDVELIMRLHHSGMSVPEIADATGDSARSVRTAIVDGWRRDKERGKASRLASREVQERADAMNAERFGDAL